MADDEVPANDPSAPRGESTDGPPGTPEGSDRSEGADRPDGAEGSAGPERPGRRGLLLAGAGLAGAGVAAAALAAIGRGSDDDGDRDEPWPGATAPAGTPPGGWRDATRDHGARGTGEGDDRGALQDAIDAAAAEGTGTLRGGTVHLGPGVYPIGDSLHLRTGVTLQGAGPGTVIRLLPGVDVPALVVQDDADGTPSANVAIRSLTLDGSVGGEQSAGRHGIAFRGANGGSRTPYTGSDAFHLVVDVLIVYFGGHGIAIGVDPPDGGEPADVRGTRVDRAVVFECAKAATDGDRAGIYVGGTDGILVACDVAGCGGPGFRVARANNRLEGCKGYFDQDEFVVTGGRTQLTGCQAQDGFGDGFVLRGADLSSIVGGQADSNAGVGFRLDGVSGAVVSGFTAFVRGDRPVGTAGVVFENGTRGCLVTGVVDGLAPAVEGDDPDGITQVVG